MRNITLSRSRGSQEKVEVRSVHLDSIRLNSFGLSMLEVDFARADSTSVLQKFLLFPLRLVTVTDAATWSLHQAHCLGVESMQELTGSRASLVRLTYLYGNQVRHHSM